MGFLRNGVAHTLSMEQIEARTSPTPRPLGRTNIHRGRWTKQEHAEFLKGLAFHGQDWKELAKWVPTRTRTQIWTHAQKHWIRLDKDMRAEMVQKAINALFSMSK